MRQLPANFPQIIQFPQIRGIFAASSSSKVPASKIRSINENPEHAISFSGFE